MHTLNDAGGNVTWDRGGESLLGLFQPGPALSKMPFFRGWPRVVSLQCKHRLQTLVCLASGLFDRLHVLLDISSDAHLLSAVNISLGYCLKIRSLKISSFNKKILLPEGLALNTSRPTVGAVDLWTQHCKSTGVPTPWLKGGARQAASIYESVYRRIWNGQQLYTYVYIYFSKMTVHFKNTCQSCLALFRTVIPH